MSSTPKTYIMLVKVSQTVIITVRSNIVNSLDLNRTTGKQRSYVIEVATIISNHLLIPAQGASIPLTKPISFHLMNLCGVNEKMASKI